MTSVDASAFPPLDMIGIAASALAAPQSDQKAQSPLFQCIFCEQRVSDAIQIVSFSPSPERYAHQYCATKHSGQLKDKQIVPRPDLDKDYLTIYALFVRPCKDAIHIPRHSETYQWSIFTPLKVFQEEIARQLGTPKDTIVKVTHYWSRSKIFVLSQDNNTLNQAVEKGVGRSPADLVPEFEHILPDEIGIEVMQKEDATS